MRYQAGVISYKNRERIAQRQCQRCGALRVFYDPEACLFDCERCKATWKARPYLRNTIHPPLHYAPPSLPPVPPLPSVTDSAWLAGVLDAGFNVRADSRGTGKGGTAVRLEIACPSPTAKHVHKLCPVMHFYPHKGQQSARAVAYRPDVILWVFKAVLPYAGEHTLRKFKAFISKAGANVS